MSESQLRSLKKHFQDLNREKLKVGEKENLVTTICDQYRNCANIIGKQEHEEIVSLFEISEIIFENALKEVAENESKSNRKSVGHKVYKTKLYELAIDHLKNCSRSNIDNNTVQWIDFSLKIIQNPFVQADVNKENAISSCILSCASNSQLHWVEHSLMKKLWKTILSRVGDASLDQTVLCNYTKTAVTILEKVETSVLENSPFQVAKVILGVLKQAATGEKDRSFWSHPRKFAYASVFSYITKRWGVEARDLVICESLDIIYNLTSVITAEKSKIDDCKGYVMALVDDLLKLVMIDKDGKKVRTVNEETERRLAELARLCSCELLKSARSLYFNRPSFELQPKFVRYIARWLMAEKYLTYSEASDDMKEVIPTMFTLQGIISLEFGDSIPTPLNKCNAWNGCVQILTEIIRTHRVEECVISEIMIILWKKRKAFATDSLRSSSCTLLTELISIDIQFGMNEIPSIDAILKYAIALVSNLTSLSSSTRLIENILRFHSDHVPKEMIRLICDTVSRTNPSSPDIVRLISAIISYTEFDENSHFCSISNDEKRSWTMRKDIVDWLLSAPSPMCHQLVYQICQFHPKFPYPFDRPIEDDSLICSLVSYNLVKPKEMRQRKKNVDLIDSSIVEMVDYVHDSLKTAIGVDFSFELFIIASEFISSTKCSLDVLDIKMLDESVEKSSNSLDEKEYRTIIEYITKWPNNLKIPQKHQSLDNIVTYYLSNIHHPNFELNMNIGEPSDILLIILQICLGCNTTLIKCQKSMPFNNYVKKYILSNNDDIYETLHRFKKFSSLLSIRNVLALRNTILQTASQFLESGNSIDESDGSLIENVLASVCIKNASGSVKFGGNELDPQFVAMYPQNVHFDDRNISIFIRKLNKSPFLAQNIVRYVLSNSSLFHLHVKMLRIVLKCERLLMVCSATIPNMRKYIKFYQVNFVVNEPVTSIIKVNSDAVRRCNEYVKKPKENGESISLDDLIILFGLPQKKWSRVVYRFWKLFERNPSIVCEKLHRFAERNISLGLYARLLHLLKTIGNSEFSKRSFAQKHIEDVFRMLYRSIFRLILKKDKSREIIELCWDKQLRSDLLKNEAIEGKEQLIEKYSKEISAFEVSIALNLERFIQKGIDSSVVNYPFLGFSEFYKQLNENLSEEIIKANEAKEVYIVDFLTTVWNLLPDMRFHIIPIIARFRNISICWSRFPQPSHTVSDGSNFLNRIRCNVAMKIMSNRDFSNLELAACMTIFLVTYDTKLVSKEFIRLVQEKYNKPNAKRKPICVVSSQLKKAVLCQDFNNLAFKTVFMLSSFFEEIAMFTVPFLLFIVVEHEEKFEFAVEVLFSLLQRIDKDSDQAVICMTNCVDSIGLNVFTVFESLSSTSFDTCHFFALSHLFLKFGYLSHAFGIANLIFDRLCSEKRNMMTIDRISLSDIRDSDAIVDLLAHIYVAEDNSVALSSLPPIVQLRNDVRKVMYKNSKDWIKLVASNILDEKDMIMARWMSGLPSDPSSNMHHHQFSNAILRFNFEDYPKIIDSTSKLTFLFLFHSGCVPVTKTGNIEKNFEDIFKQFYESIENVKMDDVRLLMLARGDKTIEPVSIEEQIVFVSHNIQEVARNRLSRKKIRLEDFNVKTSDITRVARVLAENKAYEAAFLILSKWKDECLLWPKGNVDIDLIDICKAEIMCVADDFRMAETNLRSMYSRFDLMSDISCAEYTLVLSKITLEFRNDVDEGMRLLEKGCHRLLRSQNKEAKLKLLLKFHSICVDQLSRLEEYRESRTFRMKTRAINAFEKQVKPSNRNTRTNDSFNDAEGRKVVNRIKKELQLETHEVERVGNDVAIAAVRAVSSAFEALATVSELCDETNDDESMRTSSLIIFPLIDVIYENENNTDILRVFQSYVASKFSSKLWLCATSHVASKCFSLNATPLKKPLYMILTRLIVDYPYHVLHTLFIYEFEPNGAEIRRFIDSMPNSSLNPSRLRELINEMRAAHLAYKELAMLDAKSGDRIQKVVVNGKSAYRVPGHLKLFKCKLDRLPIPVISQTIGSVGNYSAVGLITWKNWKETFVLADGLSAPKVWEIQGSDGIWYKTVWKKDDVRQDVLVEKMFDLTNNMLEKRTLRTYNVVPIDTECGIIEFCGGTISMKELLCGSSRDGGLHRDVYPDEPSANTVAPKMQKCQNESAEKRRRVFLEICQEYSPVFRRFFYYNFPTTHIWRAKIDEYRRSLATWSIVCYIVGLGDRHASNILFDQKMCTFVHIDLGMILEYSKRTLPVPEQVPFRLSRDLLDPILMDGVQNGQLAHICVETIDKLKKNGKVILGVASALLRETMSNFRETEMATDRPSYISEMAIGRLRDKLGGTDDCVTAQPSELQVRRLLREATSADNLSRMFCGWMPFM